MRRFYFVILVHSQAAALLSGLEKVPLATAATADERNPATRVRTRGQHAEERPDKTCDRAKDHSKRKDPLAAKSGCKPPTPKAPGATGSPGGEGVRGAIR
jgi:hypothetical protein